MQVAAEQEAPGAGGEDSFWDRDAPPPPAGRDPLAGRLQAASLAPGRPAQLAAQGGSGASVSGLGLGLEDLSLGSTPPVRVGGRAPAVGAPRCCVCLGVRTGDGGPVAWVPSLVRVGGRGPAEGAPRCCPLRLWTVFGVAVGASGSDEDPAQSQGVGGVRLRFGRGCTASKTYATALAALLTAFPRSTCPPVAVCLQCVANDCVFSSVFVGFTWQLGRSGWMQARAGADAKAEGAAVQCGASRPLRHRPSQHVSLP